MIRRLPPWAWLLACAILGIVVGAAWPPPPIPRAMQQEPDWVLAPKDALSRFSADTFKAATSGLRWDAAGGGDDEAKTWRLVGFLNAPPTAALIQVEGEARKAEHVRPGDELPDGGRLVAIEGDRITTEREGCQQVLQLYRTKPISRSSGCEPVADEAEARNTK